MTHMPKVGGSGLSRSINIADPYVRRRVHQKCAHQGGRAYYLGRP